MTAATNMLDATTRNYWEKTVVDEVTMANIVFAKLQSMNRVNWKGGQKVQKTIRKGLPIGQSQAYGVGEVLTDQDHTPDTTVEWNLKFYQTDVQYQCDEKVANKGSSTKIIDLVGEKIQTKRAGLMFDLLEDLYGTSSDTGKTIQTLRDACGHSRQYGQLTSNTSTATYWNGASYNGDFDDSADSRQCCFHTFRVAKDRCMLALPDQRRARNGFMAIVGPANYHTLQSEVDAKVIIAGEKLSGMRKLGFDSFVFDDIEFVKEPYLGYEELSYHANNTTPGGVDSTLAAYAFLLYMPSWKLHINEEDNFRLTPPVWQGQIVNGKDMWLQRIMAKLNLICEKPNANWFSSNLS